MTNENITEMKYIEMAEDFKEVMAVKDNKLIELKKQLISKTSLISQVYGIVCFCTNILENLESDDDTIQTMNNVLDYLESKIFISEFLEN
tara:strand:+ start:422 stop:691 length:270 start_codon:yes stop_codon:yes gene_type:complete